jgi:hypothetical protein
MLLARECVRNHEIRFTIKYQFFDGDPTIPGWTGVGSDVGTGNAEICLITANSLKQVQITCAYNVQKNSG